MKNKMLLVDVKNGEFREVQAGGLDDYYELIGCRVIDIVCRRIGGKRYEIICDDEGLYEELPQISAVDIQEYPMLVGNLLIAGPAEEGELTDLTDEDIKHLSKYKRLVITTVHPEPYPIITGMDYC